MADPGRFKRPLKVGVPAGDDVIGVKRAISRAGFIKWGEFDGVYGENITRSVKAYQSASNLPNSGIYDSRTHGKLKAEKVDAARPNAGDDCFDDRAAALYRQYVLPGSVPDLGPVFQGGRSVLLQDLTHETSGIPLYPAFDDAFRIGITIVAPEPMQVTRASSSRPGDACYLLGASKLQWWFGHLLRAPDVGVKLRKGQKLGEVAPNDLGGGPHVHVALNVELVWGKGTQLAHKTNYQHGAMPIGEQLARRRL